MLKKFLPALIFVLFFTNTYAQEKANALRHYSNARDLEIKGRNDDAVKEYKLAIDISLSDIQENPNDIDAYAVYTWSLFRLKRYNDTVAVCRQALQISQDPRIIETLGEALFYLNRFDESLEQMQRYISMAASGDRISVAYFFEAEIYLLLKQYNKAEIAYTTATFLQSGNSLWWFRLGFARELIKDKQGAIDAYRKAIKIWPNYTNALNALKRLGA